MSHVNCCLSVCLSVSLGHCDSYRQWMFYFLVGHIDPTKLKMALTKLPPWSRYNFVHFPFQDLVFLCFYSEIAILVTYTIWFPEMEPSPQQINTSIYHLYTTNQEKQLRAWLISHDLLKQHTPQGTVEPPGIRDFQKAARLRRPLRHPRRVDGCTDGCNAAFWAFAVGAWGKGVVQFYLNNNNKKTVILLVDIRVLYMNVLRKKTWWLVCSKLGSCTSSSYC